MDKKSLTERDICSKFITPAILQALCDQLRTRLAQARQLNEQLASTLVEQAVA